ncbi:MAG TPA: class I SAM-dependent methyltransferase [bacterium]|nr:class I SAM-dependent methyltransferase [bacterium]
MSQDAGPGSSALTFEKGACCLCGREDGEVVVRGNDPALGSNSPEFAFIRCPDCGILFLEPKPTAESIDLLYPDQYYARDFRAIRQAAMHKPSRLKQRLQACILRSYGLIQKPEAEKHKSSSHRAPTKPLAALWDFVCKTSVFPLAVRQSSLLRTLVYNRRLFQFRRKPARVLEVGFGNGLLLDALSHLDTELFGTEISPEACKVLAATLGVHTFCGQLWEANYEDNQFDLVIFSHSLEHLADPMRALREARRIIAPQGAVVISVPNPNSLSARTFKEHWTGYDFPRHLFLFGSDALSMMAEKVGLRLQTLHFPMEASLHHLAESINSRLGLRLIPDVASRTLITQLLYLPIIVFKAGDILTACFSAKK